ncbi:MAG: rod shape-determining protein RodA [Acidobacteriaceae bacterium]
MRSRYTSFRDFDWLLLVLVLVICALGTLEIYSTTVTSKFVEQHMHIKQIEWIGGGLIAMFLVSLIPYNVLLENVHWAYIASIASLVAVMAFGQTYLGAKRWVRVPGFGHFQPSEWVKLVLIVAVAKYFADLPQRELTWTEIAKAGAIVLVPMAMVLKQPDLGTSLTYLPPLFAGLFLAGISSRKSLIIIMLGAVMVVPIWRWGLKPYQKSRLTSFTNPESDARGSGYQVQQSLIAVGSGGIWGKGAAKGTQTQGQFLPIPHTDFIFAAWSEEHGFVGAIVMLLLYFMVLMRLIQNAQTAPDRGGTYLIMGVVAIITFHILVNVGMVVGWMPVTGIPLPLMSYGGSSVLFTFLALGIVMNVRMRRFVN